MRRNKFRMQIGDLSEANKLAGMALQWIIRSYLK